MALPRDMEVLAEQLAENAHNLWARNRFCEGWKYSSNRDDARKLHPCLVSYAELPESEKQYDRLSALETLKSIFALGYRVQRD